jgi:hypothetical protein
MALIDERLLDVDDHGAIRVPGLLWLAWAFLLRHWLVAVGIAFSGPGSPETARLWADFSWTSAALHTPVLLLVVAAWCRQPEAGRWWRAVWSQGRALMTLAIAAHLMWTGWLLWDADTWERWPHLWWASSALLDVAIAVAVWRDRFFAALFADFPNAPKASAS